MNRKAFTLIELLIVVVIIGVIAAIAIPRFANTKEKAYVAAMKTDLRNLVASQLEYFATNGRYTDDATKLSYKQSTGVRAPTIVVEGRAYTATVTHDQVPAMVCGIAHSKTNPVVASAANGEPACQ